MARPLWKGAISFGLVTIPVSLYPAKSAREDLSFHMLHKTDLSRIRNQRVDEEGHEVAYDDIVKGYEYEKDQYVVIGEAELEAANVEATQSIDIMSFVDGDDIDIAYFDTPYYTEPAKAGRKAYALLRETLKNTGKVGVAKLVIRERQHLCALVPDGNALIAYTLRWAYQLRDVSEFDLPGDDLEALGVSAQELNMAEQLVRAMRATWEPAQYRDTYRDDLLELIHKKVESGDTSMITEPPRREAPESNVVDIMSLLKKSMEQRKPAKTDSASDDGIGGDPESRAAGAKKRSTHARGKKSA